jgi:photosystem II stability/assembly factor-like uncharacterized protein
MNGAHCAFIIRYSAAIFGTFVLALIFSPRSAAQLNSWEPTGPFHGSAWGYLAVAVDPTNSDIVYTGTYHTSSGYQGIVFKSVTAGPPWTISNSGLNGSPILKIAIDPSNPNTIFAVTYRSGQHLYKSRNGGTTWYAIDPPIFGFAWSFKMSRSNPGLIYAAGDSLYFSQDEGETWISRRLPNNAAADEVAVSPYNPQLIVVSVCEYYDEENCNSRMYRSTDGGATWSQPVLDPPGDVGFGAIEFDPLVPNVVYAGTNVLDANSQIGMYRSQDQGMTWTLQSVPGPIYGLEFDPRTPTTMYAVGMFNLAKSTDGGVTWTPFTSGIPQFGPGFQEIDFSADGRFIHAATSTGVFRTQVRNDVPGFARVNGRVTTADGRGLQNVIVSMIDSLGVSRKGRSGSFGYYAIEDVRTTVTYRVYVTSKTHRFEDRLVQVDGDLSEVNFVGQPINK